MTDRDFIAEKRAEKAADLAALLRTLHRDLRRPMPLYDFALMLKRPTWDHLANSLRKTKVNCSDETRSLVLQELGN